MEIKINIPQNDYVQSKEVRQEVVQMICDYIIKRMNQGIWGEDTFQLKLTHNDWSYQLYAQRDNNCEMVQFWCNKRSRLDQIRIRTIEMDAVFRALQDAGYYIFGTAYTNGERKYTFTKKPYYDNRKATRITFSEFID